MNISLKLLEGNLCALWKFTNTQADCLAFVDALHDMSLDYPEGSDERDAVNFCRDIAFIKGNLLALKANRHYQLRQAQEAFAGEYEPDEPAHGDRQKAHIDTGMKEGDFI